MLEYIRGWRLKETLCQERRIISRVIFSPQPNFVNYIGSAPKGDVASRTESQETQ